MSDIREALAPSKTVSVVRGQYHKFMLLPINEAEAQWFAAGPVAFGIEARTFGEDGVVLERGATLHVFSADHQEEWLRFDCFEHTLHYHYILHDRGHNVVWGYDPVVNGPMRPWAIEAVRNRLPDLLRNAGADHLADAVEREGVDPAVIDQLRRALDAAWERTFPGTDMIEASTAYFAWWKQVHPQFNTVDY